MKTKGRKQSTKEECGCRGCGKEFRDEDDVIGCDECDGWWHRECGEMSVADFKVISKIKSKNVHWICPPCSIKPKESLHLEDIKKLMEKMFEEWTKTLEKKQDVKINDLVEVKVREALEEQKEAERRKGNLIIANVVESEEDGEEERMKEDRAKIIKHIKREVDVKEEEVVKIVRLGRKDESRPNKPRLLKVVINSVAKTEDIIKKAFYMNKGKPSEERIYINPDMTLKERERNKKLREEKREREGKGETNLRIRNGKIVKLPPSPSGAEAIV